MGKNYEVTAPHRYQQYLGPVNTLTAEELTEKGPFTNLSTPLFQSQSFRKYLSYETHLCFKILRT